MAANGEAELPASTKPAAEDGEHGFQRAEMHKETLVGSVKVYDVHVCVAVEKDAKTWPKNAEGDFDPLVGKISAAIKARKQDIKGKVKLTVVEGKAGDVLLIPHYVKYQGLKPEDADKFVEEALVMGKNKDLKSEIIKEDVLLVCCHANHDMRCGVCGPILVKVFQDEIAKRKLSTSVWPCSHIGGHKYAGNFITYSKRPNGTTTGDWYGYVTPEDVPKLLDAIGKGEIVEKLWRGAIGLDESAQAEVQSKRQKATKGKGPADDGACGPNCGCVEVKERRTDTAWLFEPSTWDPNTKLAATATVAALVAVGIAYYIRYQGSTPSH